MSFDLAVRYSEGRDARDDRLAVRLCDDRESAMPVCKAAQRRACMAAPAKDVGPIQAVSPTSCAGSGK
jgi:hypothetical protein